MKRLTLTFTIVVLTLLLAACQQPKPVDYAPQLDALSSSVATVGDAVAANATSLDALTQQVTALQASVGSIASAVHALSAQADALTGLSGDVSGLVATVQRLDPANSGILTIQHAPGVQLTVTVGACDGGLPAADETAYNVDTRTIARIGLPVGPACITSADPPAQLEVQLQAGQLLGVYFNAPTSE